MTAFPYRRAVDAFREQYLRRVLAAHGGNVCAAARAMEMHRNTLSRQMKALGIERQRRGEC